MAKGIIFRRIGGRIIPIKKDPAGKLGGKMLAGKKKIKSSNSETAERLRKMGQFDIADKYFS